MSQEIISAAGGSQSNVQVSGDIPQFAAMMRDVREGLAVHRAWRELAWMDIRHKYRRSVLGPFWITITMGVLIGGVGVIYSRLFGMSLKEYLPFIAVGNIVWIYLSVLFQEACGTFTGPEGLIRSMHIPMSVHIFRVVLRNFWIFLHGAVIYIPVALLYGAPSILGFFESLFGIVLLVLLTIPIVTILGVTSARFRDLLPIVSNVMQLMFFLTPVLWKVEMLKGREIIAHANPFYHIIEIIRAPLLGTPINPNSYGVVIGIIVVLSVISAFVFAFYRRKISIWV